MKRKNILFISSWFPSKVEPTNGNFVQRHAEAATILHNVEILHAIGNFHQNETYVFSEEIIKGIRILTVFYKNSNNPFQNFFRRLKSYAMGFSKMKKPDLVHANILQKPMLFAVYLKKRYKIPFIISEHWSGFLPINRSKISFVEKYIARCIAHHASYVLPVSKNLMKSLQDHRIGKVYEVIGNVINTEIFYPKKIKEEHPFVFLHISNLIALKNPESIINTALKLRKDYDHFELHIGGDGEYERLIDKIEKNNEKDSIKDFIKVFGEISHQEVAKKMRNSHCFVLFSDYESFSCVVLESLASGVPVITTNVGIISEIENKNKGFVINKSDKELYNAMENMLKSKTKEFGEELHNDISEQFSSKKIAEHFNKIYQEVL